MKDPVQEEVDALANAEDFIPYVEPPSKSPKEKKSAPRAWLPKGGPIAQAIWLSKLKYILLHGERGTCKTNILLNKLIIESYQNPNNLWLLMAIMRGSATEGGAWEKLITLNLPEWYDGIGLDFTEPRQDDQKNRYIFVANQFGGWSRVVLKSMPHGSMIGQRIRGAEPGGIAFEELTETESEEYFTKPIQQLRRPGIEHPQYIASCNPPPEGPNHWVYKKFFVEPLSEKYPEGKDLPGTFNEGEFGVWHVPMAENVFWTPKQKADYQATIMVEARSDPTAIDRLIKGLWVARPTGQGLFKEFFVEGIHIKGNALSGQGLVPVKAFPFVIGYDLGQIWNSVTFEQMIPTKDKVVWIVFDEIDHLRERILYKKLAWEVIERMRYWRKKVGYPFQAIHITDESAINQWRPGSGSYDALDFEKEYNREAKLNKEKEIRMLGAPKGEGSVGSRVRLVQGKLYQEELFVSAICQNSRAMLMNLEADDKKPENPKKDGRGLIHKFDSLSYPIHKFEVGGGRLIMPSVATVAPALIQCGRG